ncbi:MAG: ATP-binding protein [Elusimicrobiota bacterium]|jgi:ATP-dependent DNA helicase RecG
MTEIEIRALISGGESLDVEFKGEERRPLSDGDLIDAVVCLANRSGDRPGYVFLGVEDDGRITGARPRHGEGNTDPSRVQALISGRTRPSVSVQVSLHEIDGKPVLVIRIPPLRLPVGTTDGKYLRRALGGDGKPACLPFHFHEMQSLQSSRGVLDYTAAGASEATWQDLDPLEFERFRRRIRESQGRGDAALQDLPDIELAKALGAVEANGAVRVIRVMGLLLFGREEALHRHLPTHEAAFQALQGMDVKVNDFFRWPLIRLMDEIEARFRARSQEAELMVGMLRVGVPDYPERAVREAVANAFIHRDYTRLGAVHIQWHADRIDISNPGGFPEGVRLDNLLVTAPRPRNPLLADAFKRAGIVERTARGIDTIFYEQLRNGRPVPSYDRTTDTDVMLVIPGGKANLDFARLVTEESRADRPLRLDDLLVLNRIWIDRQIDAATVAVLIQKTEGEARSTLQRLVEAGLVESRGEKKGRLYHLSAATYRRLGEKAAYVRQRGFEPLQQEQMIVQFIEKHGRITRAEAADLCKLGVRQAGHLLAKLVKAEKIKLHGTRKGAWYELRS